MTITIFKNFNEVIEHKTIPEILHEIKTGKYRPEITYLRKSLAENKLEAYEKAKKSSLPKAFSSLSLNNAAFVVR